jgi:hypothetical protein
MKCAALIFLRCVLCNDLIIGIIQPRVVGLLMKDKLDRIWKEADVA